MKPTRLRIPRCRVELVKEAEIETFVLNGPESACSCLQEIASSDREQVLCLHLDVKNRVIGSQIVSIGTLSSSLIHPREVFKAAILNSAFGILLGHNHPSSDPEPSREDLEITKRIEKAGELLGIRLLDHLIVTPSGEFRSCMGHGIGRIQFAKKGGDIHENNA